MTDDESKTTATLDTRAVEAAARLVERLPKVERPDEFGLGAAAEALAAIGLITAERDCAVQALAAERRGHAETMAQCEDLAKLALPSQLGEALKAMLPMLLVRAEDSEAKNYLTTRLSWDREVFAGLPFQEVELILLCPGGKTTHQLRLDAEAEARDARRHVDDIAANREQILAQRDLAYADIRAKECELSTAVARAEAAEKRCTPSAIKATRDEMWHEIEKRAQAAEDVRDAALAKVDQLEHTLIGEREGAETLRREMAEAVRLLAIGVRDWATFDYESRAVAKEFVVRHTEPRNG